MFMTKLSWSANASRIDFALANGHCPAVLTRMNQRPTWRRFIVALLVCTSMACGAQILPQLIAQIASLDHDHGVSLHARNDGVDLVLTHHAHTSHAKNEGQAIALSTSHRAHVIHIITGPATAKQS